MLTPVMVDAHCHLSNEEFDSDREKVIGRAEAIGVACIDSAIVPHLWEKSLDISQRYPSVFSSIGLDPVQYARVEDAVQFIRDHDELIVSVGETGLDHYLIRDHKQRDDQATAFRKMIDLSISLRLPVQVHSRSAGRRALEVLREQEAVDVHMHAFDGKASLVRVASHDYGYYFSVPTSVVRSSQKRKMVKAIAIERLLLETDSPVLGPDRQSRNEPSNLTIALEETADILRRDTEELRQLVLENTLRLYRRISVH
ncbi:MAG: hypothetical protein DRO87_06060 [Candidatus Thorarchaeota archaeon]|nr:MAG: hypothetical protein DRP09_09065 [Candidatus Thorarchaeota archaeon]RLI58144.1 MAG: hypothetical protein DRO87_06060 [Candidatus Thorarchaeota archaeon]